MKKPWYNNEFEGKRVTKMGLGPLGRSFGDIVFLVQAGARVTITDIRDGEDVQKSVQKLNAIFSKEERTRVRFVLGRHELDDFTNTDVVLSASAVPLNSPYLIAAQKHNVPVYTSAALLFELVHKHLPDVITIGVTGTKGKSTTTDMLETVFKTAKRKYHIAGNVRGVANLPVLLKVKNKDIILAELDSWQLQGFGFRKLSPKISLFTSFFEDHLNYYKGSMEKYFLDKSYIYKHQATEDLCFATAQAYSQIKKFDTVKQIKKITHDTIPATWKLRIIGDHNISNAALALAVADVVHVRRADSKKALTGYTAMEGRLMLVAKKGGILFYDDNNSTTPESTLANLKAIKDKYSTKGVSPSIVWLGGGADKDFDYSHFAKRIDTYADVQIYFAGSATAKIQDLLPKKSSKRRHTVSSMKDAFVIIRKEVCPGTIVILSPAAASFEVFKNEYDRGDQFNTFVKRFIV